MDIFRKICDIKNEFFKLEFSPTMNELELLKNIYHKFRLWSDYTIKIKNNPKISHETE